MSVRGHAMMPPDWRDRGKGFPRNACANPALGREELAGERSRKL